MKEDRRDYFEQSIFWDKNYLNDQAEKERIEITIENIPMDVRSILDVGCGNGRLFELFKDVDYTGIDNNKMFINIAQKNYTSAKFVRDNLVKFKSPYQADLIFSIAAFHHIPSTALRKKSIQNLHNNLKDEGVLILTVWNLFQKKYRKYVLKAFFKFLVTNWVIALLSSKYPIAIIEKSPAVWYISVM